jgi:hypothetical protein
MQVKARADIHTMQTKLPQRPFFILPLALANGVYLKSLLALAK